MYTIRNAFLFSFLTHLLSKLAELLIVESERGPTETEKNFYSFKKIFLRSLFIFECNLLKLGNASVSLGFCAFQIFSLFCLLIFYFYIYNVKILF